MAGIKVTQEDFIQKVICVQDELDPRSIQPVVVLTSKTAALAWIDIVNGLGLDVMKYDVYCLAAGASILGTLQGVRIVGVGHDAASLVDIILKDTSIEKVSFICGNLRREELPEKLTKKGIQVQEIIVYKTNHTPIKICEDYQGVLFFSPSGIDSYLMMNKNTDCTAFCLGTTTANHAQNVGFSKIQVADISTPESLIMKVLANYMIK